MPYSRVISHSAVVQVLCKIFKSIGPQMVVPTHPCVHDISAVLARQRRWTQMRASYFVILNDSERS